jgi:hypothetical protein
MASELYTMNPVGGKKAKARRAKRRRLNTIAGYYPNPGSSPKRKKVKRGKSGRKRTPAQVAARRRRMAATTFRPTFRGGFRTRPRKMRGSRRRAAMGGGAGKLSLRGFMALVQQGAMQGAGALATDVALSFVRPMLPTMLSYGQGRHLTRIGIGLVLGNLVGRMGGDMGRRFGNAITIGTATVAGFDFMKETIGPMLPAGMVLGEYPDMMGEYPDMHGLGYGGSAPSAPVEMGNMESSYYGY